MIYAQRLLRRFPVSLPWIINLSLSLCQCYTGLVIIAMWYVSKSGRMVSSILHFLLKIILAVIIPFFSHIGFITNSWIAAKESCYSFYENQVNPAYQLRQNCILTMLSLPICAHSSSLCYLSLSNLSCSFQNVSLAHVLLCLQRVPFILRRYKRQYVFKMQFLYVHY